MNPPATLPPADAEWLETDGLGGFASGTVSGIRTRRYHALLLTATAPPSGRMVLVNGFDASLETPHGIIPLTAQRYAPDVVQPAERAALASFAPHPWPKWTFHAEGGYEVEQELLTPHGASAIYLGWKITKAPEESVRLLVRPFLSGRDFHATHHENGAFRFAPEEHDGFHCWWPYVDVPGIVVKSNGRYSHEPLWYRQFLYSEERSRGLDAVEDLAAPGVYAFDLRIGDEAELAFAATGHEGVLRDSLTVVKEREGKRRAAFPTAQHQAADAYVVRRGGGSTIMAGYPWFGDWGRDTFIAMRGLCLATKRLRESRQILLEWAGAVSEGLLPNRFPDHGETAEYHSVDAALWFIITTQEYLNADASVSTGDRKTLQGAVEAILEGCLRGTLFGIRMDDDALLACGVPGRQLTWMDAKVGDWVVTPRVGKPVEVQALWINALAIGASFNGRWAAYRDSGMTNFAQKFWNEDVGALYDVIDVDHQPGLHDASIRPNQIFAIGGLPIPMLQGERARRVVEMVEERLLTPVGLRTLAPGSHGYVAHYEGDVHHRDAAYHQGTVWPWLIGPFIDAWLRVHGDTAENREEAKGRFLQGLRTNLDTAGLGHISEIADAEPPHTPRGAPFQAWSLGEFLRMEARLS